MESGPSDGRQFGSASPTNGDVERPATSMSISSQHEMGSEAMMSFFRAQMTGILKPIGENVEELHNTVFSITDSLRELRSRIEMNTHTFAENAASLQRLRGETDQIMGQIKTMQPLLQNTIAEKAELEATVSNMQQSAKQAQDKVDATFMTVNRSVEECQRGIDKNARAIVEMDIEAIRNDIGRNSKNITVLNNSLDALEKRHDMTLQTLKNNKLAFDKHVLKHETLQQEQQEYYFKFERFENHFRELESKITQSRKEMLQHREEAKESHNEAVHMLSAHLEVHEKALAKATERFQEVDANVAAAKEHIVQSGQNTRKIIQFNDERRAAEVQELRKEVVTASAERAKHSITLGNLQEIIYGLPPDSEGKNCVELLREDMKLSMRRSKRIEGVLGLDPLSKDSEEEEEDAGLTLKNGILLTSAQIAVFQKTFSEYDVDNSGSISTLEIGNILQSLGHELEMDVVQLIVNEIDSDRSGEIGFDEFCSMMSKILGPDGEVNVNGYLSQMTEAAKREAKQTAMTELLPLLKEDVEKHATLIEQEQTKLMSTNTRLQSVERDAAFLASEIQKLRKGLSANNEYWKGLSQGLKETKKTMYQEGDGEILPSAAKLRNLPPLDNRPATHPSHSAR
eukprot:gnl/TRDRNA2_/TRDRNA2_154374_c1_seq1.p1 gnl/TRDRNA2_/TRDRNA2_154374_c1~~gnl/TRDRNA2_/TRDRNA2_154374_c1_seq1.p1  ORF type:complete len:627 (-),score=146.42 gnl/TRDRNA2_/TRDRNA2_154374_c1_seq1:156-2036(-)